MTIEKLVNQHILEYESRLNHITELYDRAHQAVGKLQSDSPAKAKLDEIALAKERLENEFEQLKTMDVEHWREETVNQSGPMAIWDIVAQKLEDFVEHHQHTKDSELKD